MKGHESEDIFELLYRMKVHLRKKAWDELERAYYSICVSLGGADIATRISLLPFQIYEKQLDISWKQTVAAAKQANIAAIYFEYDMSNEWGGRLFLCETYRPEADGDDDWACEWFKDIEAPTLIEASRLSNEFGFDETPLDRGVNAYLVARTVAAFGRCCTSTPINDVAVCIGFHDQDTVLRIQHGKRRAKPIGQGNFRSRVMLQVDERARYLLRNYAHLLQPNDQITLRQAQTCVPKNLDDIRSTVASLNELAHRIMRNHSSNIIENRCPECGVLCRHPHDKQCASCRYQWV